jgi:acyl carrier protein
MDEIEIFIRKIEAEIEEIQPGTLQATARFREIPEWSSMHALILIALAETEYNVTVTGADLRSCNTLQDLYEIIKSRSN